MRTTEALKAIMEEQGISNIKLASRLGVTPAVSWDRVNNDKKKNGLSVRVLAEMLAVMDYKLVIVPRETKVTGGYVIEK